MKAGYLEEEPTKSVHVELSLKDVQYVEFGIHDIRYHLPERVVHQQVESLVEFTDLLEEMQENDFIKLDSHLLVNLRKIKKYAPSEGKLYFDESYEGPSVTIASLPQRKFHLLLLEAEAANTGTKLVNKSNQSGSFVPKLFP
ncbi:LytTR family transcriptional regulator DNA-binding domain-containing protein [Paenibacillus hexagrammi]|uniref:LytTR family transcriptional regulator DNA-binding domain-containing protein n=1 Tax=Paenibacillus hexagrammi TaxID=2908839 RepID=A0ABY3SKM7_9BACL|nr:LytTR family transcriptional regulator DNA-binding domain-containing protein [Paenibacillus sp. YPD9-1]UJF34398.1 LytTR family transcriptional regulator DNA-binding domain-containing protein [Paenibacillus sp. YPD9-1]